jgi:hypothetical protein
MNMPERSNKIELNLFHFRRKLRSMCLIFTIICLPISGCAQTKPELVAEPAQQGVVPAPKPVVQPPSSEEQPKVYFQRKYDLELSMGGDCPETEQSSMTWGVGRCIGQMPTYFTDFLAALAAKRLTTSNKATYQKVFDASSYNGKFYFLAVPSFGRRPDILVSLNEGAWVRSFEGTDPTITLYLVNAPFVCNGKEWKEVRKTDRAWECERSIPRFRLFRVKAQGIPEDVTETMLPKPVLSPVERKHYFARGKVELEHYQLPNVPVMQWYLLLDGDHPLPKSDLRWIIGGSAHFGFVVWNGKSFELRERVPHKLWPCYQSVSVPVACKPQRQTDRFIIDAE